MKTLKLIAVGIIFMVTSSINAQVSINVNIGSPPSWAPVGYSEVDYYYLPDVEAYYDVRATQFIYFGNGRWIRASHLPRQYRNYDLYGGYKVVLNDYHGNRPYSNFKNHKVKYYRGYHGQPQRSIGDRPVRNRREVSENRGHDNNEHHGRGNEKGHGKGNKHRD